MSAPPTTADLVVRRVRRDRRRVAVADAVEDRRIRWLTGLTVLGVFLVCLVPTLDAHRPMVFEDEMGYLLNARFLSGVGSVPLTGRMGFYNVGWSLPLVPLNWLVHDPAHLYRAVVTFCALLGGLSVLPLRALAARFGLRGGTALLAAGAAALLPGRVLMSGYAYAEAWFSIVFLLALLAALRWQDRPTLARAVTFGALAGYLFGIHGRGVGMAAAAVVVLAFVAIRRRSLADAAGAVAAVAVSVGFYVLNKYVEHAIYTTAFDRGAETLGAFADVRPRPFAAAATGATWYLGVSTVGVAVAGAVLLVVRVVRRGPLERKVAWIWWAGAVASVAATTLPGMSIATARGPRLDYVTYGRHFDSIAPALVVLGLTALLLRRRRRAAVAGVAALPVLAVLLALLAGTDRFSGQPIAALSVAGIASMLDPGVERLPVAAITVVATLVGMAAVALSFRFRRTAVVAVGAVFVVSGVVGEFRTMRHLDAPWQDAVVMQDTPAMRRLTDVSMFEDLSLYGQNGYQFWLPDTRFHFLPPGGTPHTRYVIAADDWPAGVAAGAAIVAREPAQRLALWDLRPSP